MAYRPLYLLKDPPADPPVDPRVAQFLHPYREESGRKVRRGAKFRG